MTLLMVIHITAKRGPALVLALREGAENRPLIPDKPPSMSPEIHLLTPGKPPTRSALTVIAIATGISLNITIAHRPAADPIGTITGTTDTIETTDGSEIEGAAEEAGTEMPEESEIGTAEEAIITETTVVTRKGGGTEKIPIIEAAAGGVAAGQGILPGRVILLPGQGIVPVGAAATGGAGTTAAAEMLETITAAATKITVTNPRLMMIVTTLLIITKTQRIRLWVIHRPSGIEGAAEEEGILVEGRLAVNQRAVP